MLSLLQPVAEGASQKFYIPTHRGLFLGQELIVYEHFLARIQELGVDNNGYYFVSDAAKDVPMGVGIYNKSILGGLLIADTYNCDNQSPSLTIKRDTYGTGDTFGIWNELNYQGNIMSGGGDEGGVGVTSELIHDLDCFWGTVESWNAVTHELIYKSSRTENPAENPQNPHKLGTSRPSINMNPSRWRTEGQVKIVGAGFDYLRIGTLQEDPNRTRLSSSLIIGDSSTHWDESVVGQFFTVDDSSEYYQEGEDYYHADSGKIKQPTRRWWHITHLEKRNDGRFNLYVERIWWNNTDIIKGGPSLFRVDNYTFNEKNEKALNYIIAPGAWVADVRDAVAVPSAGKVGLAEQTLKRIIKLAPAASEQKLEEALFNAGDHITNAPGPQPWNPSGFRSRHFHGFPSLIENASFTSYNTSKVQVSAGLSISDSHTGKSLDEVIERQKDRKPAFKSGMRLSASTQFGIFIDGPFQQAAIEVTTGPGALSDANILFGDKSKAGLRIIPKTDAAIDLWSPSSDEAQRIRWKWWDGAPGTIGNPHDSTLTIKPRKGDFVFEGGHIDLNGQGSLNHQGLSGSSISASNLRGINITPQKDSTSGYFFIPFPKPEVDDRYSVQVETSWLTQRAITKKTTEGFQVKFDVSPPENGTIDWLLIR